MIKFQPYKSCHCGWCKGSLQLLSGTQAKREWKKTVHRKFRRDSKRICHKLLLDPLANDYNFGSYVSGDRMY